jgi:hypothetical protein
MFLTPPDISLPIVMPPLPRVAFTRRTMTFSVGLLTRQPSSFSPLFSETQSSLLGDGNPRSRRCG